MRVSGQYPIDVVTIGSTAAIDRDHYASGKHRYHIGEAMPIEYSTPSLAALDEQQGVQITDAAAERIKFRNRFDEVIPDGEELTVLAGPDGIAHVLVWPCSS